MDEADAAPILKPKPMDVGRYDCVFSAGWVAKILNLTLATAAEVDRTLGYEANATGTSYLGSDPFAVLGTAVASARVNITAERSTPIGLATAKWDDEGVATQDFPLVQNGVLANYPTTREQASWLAPWSAKHGRPVQSLGCARAPDALHEPMQHTSNLILHPGTGSVTEASLESELDHGLHFHTAVGFAPTVDWQRRNVFINPVVAVEVRRGKVVGFPSGNMALMINADQFWKNIQAMGGPSSAEYLGWNPLLHDSTQPFPSTKGDPERSAPYSISAVPMRVAQLPLLHVSAQ
jgi:TldD protein